MNPQQAAYLEKMAKHEREADAARFRLRDLRRFEAFLSDSDADECLAIINVLIGRVSSITGIAPELEDAACKLIQHIENEEE